jgi:hypothetical protein
LDGTQVAMFEFRNAEHGGKHVAICSGLCQLPLGVPVTQVLLHIVRNKPVSMQRLGSACGLGRASECFEAVAEQLQTSFKLFEGSV